MLVLVVEDHAMLRSVISEALRNRPCVEEVRECADGRSALELLDGFRPDLIICDYGLPDMTGIDILRELKQKFPHAATVLCSVGVPSELPPPEEWLDEHVFCDKSADLLRCLLQVIEKHRRPQK